MLALADWFAATVGRSPGSRLIERDGVLAVVNPEVPERSVFNSVGYTDPAALAAPTRSSPRAYAERGCAWTVWVRPRRRRRPRRCWRTPATLSTRAPRAMGMPSWRRSRSPTSRRSTGRRGRHRGAAALINDHAYGYAGGNLAPGSRSAPGRRCLTYVAGSRARPAPTVAPPTIPSRRRRLLDLVRGDPEEARGRGLATALMRRALWDAREGGCATTTLQATKLGRPVYERVGYRDFGALQMWELRPPELAGRGAPEARPREPRRRRVGWAAWRARSATSELDAAIERLSDASASSEAERIVAPGGAAAAAGARLGARGRRLVRRVARGGDAEGGDHARPRRADHRGQHPARRGGEDGDDGRGRRRLGASRPSSPRTDRTEGDS